MEVFVGVLVVCGVLLLLSKLGDLALTRGPFWLFLAITLIGSGLFIVAVKVAQQTGR